jgi:hypothetical protein
MIASKRLDNAMLSFENQLIALGNSFTRGEQPKRCEPRFVQIHAGVLLGSDAFESGIHEAHELEAAE